MADDVYDGTVELDGAETSSREPLTVDLVSFGEGEQPLVILPGLSDGLTTVSGRGGVLAWHYRAFAHAHRVSVVSRPNEIPDDYSTRAMAADYAALFRSLEWEEINLLGVSQGGMIAQWIAIDAPDLLRRLCLTVTTAGPTETLVQSVGRWMQLARAGRHGDLMRDTMRRTYTPRRLLRYLLLFPLLGIVGRPSSYRRFLVQAQACLDHDARDELERIATPTLVIGGDCDRVVGPGTSEELAARIPRSRLELYPGLGHGAFEEAGDFTAQVMGFFGQK